MNLQRNRKIILAGICFVFLIAVFCLSLLFYPRDNALNLVLITLDTTRSDYLSSYNPDADPTPNFDLIAKKSILFENAYSLIPVTFPAHTSMFVSRPPHEVGIFYNGDVLTDKTPTMTELLKKKGFKTGAFVSLGSLKKSFALSRGFDVYEEVFRARGYASAEEVNSQAIPWIRKNAPNRFFAWVHYSDPHFPYLPPDAPPDTEILINGISAAKVRIARRERTKLEFVAKPAENIVTFRALPEASAARRNIDSVRLMEDDAPDLEFLTGWEEEKKKKSTSRSFLKEASVRFVNPSAKEELLTLRFIGQLGRIPEEARKGYAAEVKYMDSELGKLWNTLSELKLLDRTLIVITADHGEALGEKNHIGHISPLIEQLTRVPLIIYSPGKIKAGRSKELVCHLDILPTVLNLLKMKNKSKMSGISLVQDNGFKAALTAENSKRSRVFSATYAPAASRNSFALVEMPWKLVLSSQKEGWKPELYNLAEDRQEEENVIDSSDMDSTSLERIRSALEEYGNEAEARQSQHKNPKLDEDAKEMLRDLGYIAQ